MNLWTVIENTTTAIRSTPSIVSDRYLIRLDQLFIFFLTFWWPFLWSCHTSPVIIVLVFRDLSTATRLFIILLSVAVHPTHGLLTAAPCRATDISLRPEHSKQDDTSRGMHFRSAITRVPTKKCFSRYFCSGVATIFIASGRIFFQLFLRVESLVACTPLFSGTVVKDVKLYTEVSSSSQLSSSSTSPLTSS